MINYSTFLGEWKIGLFSSTILWISALDIYGIRITLKSEGIRSIYRSIAEQNVLGTGHNL